VVPLGTEGGGEKELFSFIAEEKLFPKKKMKEKVSHVRTKKKG